MAVEEFINHHLLDWAFSQGAVEDDPRVLLILERASNSLVGLAAHERAFLGSSDADKIAGTKLQVVAVARDWQGKRFESGERASDVVLSAVMTDIVARRPPRDARVYAIVHVENTKSIALCRRHGLTSELERRTG